MAGASLAALVHHVAALFKVATASLDDVATQAARAGIKAAGVVIDDTAVTPAYALGFPASRELPIVAEIALGSLRNKLLFLLPAALLLAVFAPWAITPLLMLGGTYLCFEAAEKIWHAIHPASAGHDAAPAGSEAVRVRGAIQTDFVLSAEIMTITLASLPQGTVWVRGAILAIVGVALTGLVYGAVAILVKADDVGLAFANNPCPITNPLGRSSAGQPAWADRVLAPLTRSLGRAIVAIMPIFLGGLAAIGVVAMVWVGGGILLHAVTGYGFTGMEHALDRAALAAGVFGWGVHGVGAAGLGLVVGGVLVGVRKVVGG